MKCRVEVNFADIFRGHQYHHFGVLYVCLPVLENSHLLACCCYVQIPQAPSVEGESKGMTNWASSTCSVITSM